MAEDPKLRGWCNYFRHGVSKATFGYLDHYVWLRVTRWLRKRHHRINWKTLFRRFLTYPERIPKQGKTALFQCKQVEVTRYRFRGTRIPTPWNNVDIAQPHSHRTNPWRAGCVETRTSGSEGRPEKPTASKNRQGAPA